MGAVDAVEEFREGKISLEEFRERLQLEEDLERVALKEVLIDVESAVRTQNMLLRVGISMFGLFLLALFLLYMKLDAWQFATKVMG